MYRIGDFFIGLLKKLVMSSRLRRVHGSITTIKIKP
jgi:hypothetical protein